MGVRKRVYTCDCCGEDIIKTGWLGGFLHPHVTYYKIPWYHWYLEFNDAHKKMGDKIICSNCFKDICDFVAEKRTVNFQVEVE